MDKSFYPDRLSILPAGYFGTSADNIFTVENIMSEQELDILLHAAKNLDIWQESSFKNKYSDPEKLKQLSTEAYTLLETLRDRWKEKVADFYNIDIDLIGTYINPLCKWPIGNTQRPHADKEWEDGSPGDQNYYDIGSVIYLNDDYEGGEIYFIQHDISVKPKSRSATAFPGDLFYFHGVTEVKGTERYTIPIFWTVYEYDAQRDKSLTE